MGRPENRPRTEAEVEEALVATCPHRRAAGGASACSFGHLPTSGRPTIDGLPVVDRAACGACVRSVHAASFHALRFCDEPKPEERPVPPHPSSASEVPSECVVPPRDPKVRCWAGGEDYPVVPVLDRYRGGSALLIGGGPSLSEGGLLGRLRDSTALKMAVNNVGALVRPDLWCCVDAPAKFHHAIWGSPRIEKFAPDATMMYKLRRKLPSGEFVDSGPAREAPNVRFYRRSSEFRADTFLSSPSFDWGRPRGEPDTHGEVGGRSVILVALKLLWVMGVRDVYLCGVDLGSCVPGREYCFPQHKHAADLAGGGRSDPHRDNERGFETLRFRLGNLAPYFEAAGFRVRIVGTSRLDGFPKCSYDEAISAAESFREDSPDLSGWYD